MFLKSNFKNFVQQRTSVTQFASRDWIKCINILHGYTSYAFLLHNELKTIILEVLHITVYMSIQYTHCFLSFFLNFSSSPSFPRLPKKITLHSVSHLPLRGPHESPPTVWQNRGARRPAPGSMGPIQKAWKTNMAMGKSTHFSIGNIYLQMVDVSLILHCHVWFFLGGV